MCGNPSAGHHPLPQRPRERSSAHLGVHQAAAAEAGGPRVLKLVPCPRRLIKLSSYLPVLLKHCFTTIWTDEIDSDICWDNLHFFICSLMPKLCQVP